MVEFIPRRRAARDLVVARLIEHATDQFDDPIYDHNPEPRYGPFPTDWRNPFRRKEVDAGAILVGAGAPPLGVNVKLGT